MSNSQQTDFYKRKTRYVYEFRVLVDRAADKWFTVSSSETRIRAMLDRRDYMRDDPLSTTKVFRIRVPLKGERHD